MVKVRRNRISYVLHREGVRYRARDCDVGEEVQNIKGYSYIRAVDKLA
jgi:hypothetical protein